MSGLSRNSLKNIAIGNHWSSSVIRDMAFGKNSATGLFEGHTSFSRSFDVLIVAAFSTSDGQTKEGHVLKKYLTRMDKMRVSLLPYFQLEARGLENE